MRYRLVDWLVVRLPWRLVVVLPDRLLLWWQREATKRDDL